MYNISSFVNELLIFYQIHATITSNAHGNVLDPRAELASNHTSGLDMVPKPVLR